MQLIIGKKIRDASVLFTCLFIFFYYLLVQEKGNYLSIRRKELGDTTKDY